jgi:hypothetical protein
MLHSGIMELIIGDLLANPNTWDRFTESNSSGVARTAEEAAYDSKARGFVKEELPSATVSLCAPPYRLTA